MGSAIPKQEASFPIAAIIHKGAPQVERKNDQGKTYRTWGADLESEFRVSFAQGYEDLKRKFIMVYGSERTMHLKAMIPFPKADQAWECYNEAYNMGRRIAQADDLHYITKRDPLTGLYQVVNGDPYTPYNRGDKITYERGHRKFELEISIHGRLKLWLPQLDMRMVYFQLNTTSYYDCVNIQQNLAAVQAVADALPSQRGSVTGMPIWIYRAQRDICWNKPDGSAQRVSKWIVQIEIDPKFVAQAFTRMERFALFGSDQPQLNNGDIIVGEEDPDQDEQSQVDKDWAENERWFAEHPSPTGGSGDAAGR